ncbi:hypothetical protein DFH27DRAFT_609016 [Peziza echinospora]|nr:hypothetical protein DFH27DRAFT_609016 [Peziza echinospora]
MPRESSSSLPVDRDGAIRTTPPPPPQTIRLIIGLIIITPIAKSPMYTIIPPLVLDEIYEKIKKWLLPLQFGYKQSVHLNRWQVGTGKWLTEHVVFKEWIAGKRRVLVCEGIAGAGKSTLLAMLITAAIDSS